MTGILAGLKTILSKNDNKVNIIIILSIFIIALSIRMFGIMDVGITYDEPIYLTSSVAYIDAITDPSKFSPDIWTLNMEHPPVSKYIYGLAVHLLNGGDKGLNAYNTVKAISAAFGALTCVLAFLMCSRFFNRNIGAASAVILALLPVFMAQTQIATIDSPLAFLFTLTAFLFMLALQTRNRYYFIGFCLSFGLMISTKYIALLILPILAVFYVMHEYGRWKKDVSGKAEKKGRKARDNASILDKLNKFVPVLPLLAFIGIAIGMFFILWPYLWQDPLGHLNASLNHWTYIPQEYLLGTMQSAPLYYYPLYFLVTTPALLLIPLIIGIISIAISKDVYKQMFLLWLAIPFLYGLSSFVQDGMRYLLMIYPAVAIICVYGLFMIAGYINKKFNVSKDAVFALLSILVAVYLVLSLASVFPFYVDYYNELTGGQANVYENKLFEIGYLGEGIRQGMEYVESTAAPGSQVMMMTMPDEASNTEVWKKNMQYMYISADDSFRNFVATSDLTYEFEFNGNVTEVSPTYVIVNAMAENMLNVSVDLNDFRLIHTVDVQGAPIVKVYQKI